MDTTLLETLWAVVCRWGGGEETRNQVVEQRLQGHKDTLSGHAPGEDPQKPLAGKACISLAGWRYPVIGHGPLPSRPRALTSFTAERSRLTSYATHVPRAAPLFPPLLRRWRGYPTCPLLCLLAHISPHASAPSWGQLCGSTIHTQ